MSDELLEKLTAARPPIADGLLEPNHALLEEILMTDPAITTDAPHRRFVTPRRLAAVATAAAVVAALAITLPNHGSSPSTRPRVVTVAAPDMQTVAASTAAALTSGIAHLTYSSNDGHFIHDAGTLTVQFAGENRSSVGTQSDTRADGFQFANKVFDGHFYLLDGAPGQQSWIEDTNEHLTGSDIFSADPRGLLTGAAQEADFKDVGTATVDGVPTRHLKATQLDKVPTLNLGLGPIQDNATKVTKFDVWVDSDNVVRRLDITTAETETVYPDLTAHLEKQADGSTKKVIDEASKINPEQRTTVNDYSVIFTDIGSNIVIEAPANSRKVAGQG